MLLPGVPANTVNSTIFPSHHFVNGHRTSQAERRQTPGKKGFNELFIRHGQRRRSQRELPSQTTIQRFLLHLLEIFILLLNVIYMGDNQ